MESVKPEKVAGRFAFIIMSIKLRYFNLKNGIITPKGSKSYYWFDQRSLKETPAPESNYCFIFNFAKKAWVTDEMVKELISLCAELYPEIDHSNTFTCIIEHRQMLEKMFGKDIDLYGRG